MAANANKTHFPRSGGNKWVQSFYDEHGTTGNVWYVGPSGTDSSGYGHSPEAPLATIKYAASTAATASNGDLVLVLPGHTETVTAAAGVAMSKAGVKVKGLGRGRNRPTITFTTANGASFDITAANCVVENLVLVNGKDGQTAMVNVSAADVLIKDCEFKLGDATTQTTEGIVTTAAADRLRVEGCHLHCTVDAGVTDAIHLVGGDSIVIKDCMFSGAFSTSGIILNDTTAATNLVIWNNTMLNQTADGNNKIIVLHSSTTGIIASNRGGIIDSTSPAPITAAAAWVAGNYVSTAVGVAASTLI